MIQRGDSNRPYPLDCDCCWWSRCRCCSRCCRRCYVAGRCRRYRRRSIRAAGTLPYHVTRRRHRSDGRQGRCARNSGRIRCSSPCLAPFTTVFVVSPEKKRNRRQRVIIATTFATFQLEIPATSFSRFSKRTIFTGALFSIRSDTRRSILKRVHAFFLDYF